MRLRSPICWNFVVHHRPPDLKHEDIGPHLLKVSEEDRNAIIGLCGMLTAPEIGYSFHPSVWGKGIATEAIGGLVKTYWETFPDGHPCLGGEEKMYLEGHTDRGNLASQAVLRKNGFEFWKEVEETESVDGGEPEMMLVWRRWKSGFESGMIERRSEKERVGDGTVKESVGQD